jgi:ribose 5-phosphate isomerase B
MAANKVKGIRAALCWSVETAKLAKEHNNANVIALGGRMHTQEVCIQILDAFISTPFSQDERHIRRINKISAFEGGK